MADHAEEQEMEAEALSAIFDTFFEIKDSRAWAVKIYPEQGDPLEINGLNHVGCELLISLPETYPEVLPDLDLKIVKGLAPDHKDELLLMAKEEAEANLGVPCIFAIAERLREWLVENNEKGLDDVSMHAQMMRKQAESAKKELKAQATFESQKQQDDMTLAEKEELAVQKLRSEGTPCNKENFDAWVAQFTTQQLDLQSTEQATLDTTKTKKKEKIVDKTGRLTGFEQFSGKIDDLEALEAAAEQAEADEFEAVDEELFDDDVDLDDLDFDDEDDDDGGDDEVDI